MGIYKARCCACVRHQPRDRLGDVQKTRSHRITHGVTWCQWVGTNPVTDWATYGGFKLVGTEPHTVLHGVYSVRGVHGTQTKDRDGIAACAALPWHFGLRAAESTEVLPSVVYTSRTSSSINFSLRFDLALCEFISVPSVSGELQHHVVCVRSVHTHTHTHARTHARTSGSHQPSAPSLQEAILDRRSQMVAMPATLRWLTTCRLPFFASWLTCRLACRLLPTRHPCPASWHDVSNLPQLVQQHACVHCTPMPALDIQANQLNQLNQINQSTQPHQRT